MKADTQSGTARRNTVHVSDVATLERCHTCYYRETCVRHAPKTCGRTDHKAMKRVATRNSNRALYLSREEIEILSILEIGFAAYIPRPGKLMENSL